MSVHANIVKASNSNAYKVLKKVYDNIDDFSNVFDAFDFDERYDMLHDLFINKGLLLPFNNKLPLFYVLSDDVFFLAQNNHSVISTFKTLEIVATRERIFSIYKYSYYRQVITVYIFNKDLKHIKSSIRFKLVKIA